jgi:hypothetical protein
MSDRAFVYGAIIIGTLAISLDFASVDLALPALEADARTVRALSVILWLSAGLALISVALVLRFVKPTLTPPIRVEAHAGESPHR